MVFNSLLQVTKRKLWVLVYWALETCSDQSEKTYFFSNQSEQTYLFSDQSEQTYFFLVFWPIRANTLILNVFPPSSLIFSKWMWDFFPHFNISVGALTGVKMDYAHTCFKFGVHTQHVIKPQCSGWITLFIAFLGVDPRGFQFFHHTALMEVQNSKRYFITPRRTLLKRNYARSMI